MATAVRDSERSEATLPRTVRRVRRARWRWLAAGSGIVMLAVWCLPMVVAHTPLGERCLASMARTAGLEGSITAEQLSLGWLSPVAAYGIEVRTASGEPLARVPAFSTQKSLLGLLASPAEVGAIRVERPSLELALREQGSNLEDSLAAWLAPDRPPQDVLGFELNVLDGQVIVRDTVVGEQWKVDKFAVHVSVPAHATGPIEATASGNVSDQAVAGQFSLGLKAIRSAPTATESGQTSAAGLPSGQLSLSTESLPLGLGQAVLRRMAPGHRLAGRLDAKIEYRWELDRHGQPRHSLVGRVGAGNLYLAGSCLAPDELRLTRLEIPCRIEWQPDRLTIEQLAIACDLGDVALQGSVTAAKRPVESAATEAGGGTRLMELCRGLAGEVEGRFDVARLAEALPETIRVRDGTRITSGVIDVKLASRPDAAGWAWQGRLETTRLTAQHAGRELAWDKPLTVEVKARQGEQGPVIDRLRCESDFLELEGKGTPDLFSISASYDLGRLADELGRFFDVGQVKLSGDGAAHATWKRQSDGKFVADADLDISGFELAAPNVMPWQEEKLTTAASATGTTEGLQPRRLETASFLLTSGRDRLAVELTEPVADVSSQALPVEVQLQGQLTRWCTRLKPWLSVPNAWSLEGQAELVADARLSAAQFDFERTQLVVQEFHLRGPGLAIDEPLVRADASATWIREPAQLTLRELAIHSQAASIQVPEARLAWPKGAAELNGKLSLRGNLAGIERWMPTQDAAAAPGWHFAGHMSGDAEVRLAGGTNATTMVVSISDLIATPDAGNPWREPHVNMSLEASYDRAADVLRLARFDVQSDAATLESRGEIAQASGRRVFEWSGRVNYDLEKLRRLYEPYLKGQATLSGRESHSLLLSGALRPDHGQDILSGLSGKAGLGWQTAAVLGFPLGAGHIDTELAAGIFKVTPTELEVSQGKLRLAPSIDLTAQRLEMVHGPGRVIDNVRITPEMCNSGLKYVAPVLADVTQAQGTFSLDLESCRLPLADPAQGDVAGRMIVHSIDVGPTAMAQELATMIQVVSQLVTRSTRPPRALSTVSLSRESEVSFRLVEGRVYHRDLTLEFPDVTVRTYGSVGLDQSLAVMAEMPIPDKWIGNNPLGEALRGQILRLPLGGTLHKPKIDQRELDRLAAQIARDAASGVLRNELNRQLDKLFGPLGKQP